MEAWVVSVIENYGYVGVFIIMVVENLFPPIPSEIVLPFSGFMTTKSTLTFTGVWGVATLGSVTGAIILYWIGSILHAERLERIVERWGHILRLKKQDVARADAWFDNYGIWTVLFGRMIPLIRSLISIPAGISGMGFFTFLLFSLVGTSIWNALLIYLGARLGEAWPKILGFFHFYSNIIYLCLAILIIVGIYILVIKRRK